MLRSANKGVLFRAPQNVIEENSDLPVANTYEELKVHIEEAIYKKMSSERYKARGVSSDKKEVHAVVDSMDRGLFLEPSAKSSKTISRETPRATLSMLMGPEQNLSSLIFTTARRVTHLFLGA